MLARQIANLALERLSRIARRVFSRAVRVQVRAGRSAVEVGDWELVDVVHCEKSSVNDDLQG